MAETVYHTVHFCEYNGAFINVLDLLQPIFKYSSVYIIL
jgi:hypothetical protein